MRGTWISIEGVEGVGKSTLASALSTRFNAASLPEFSDACYGLALDQAVRESPHFIGRSLLGQSLVFLGDSFELYEGAIVPLLERGEIVISDRGPFSRWLYQTAVLERSMGFTAASAFIRSIVDLMRRPDAMIYLDCPADVLQQRLLARDGKCDEERMEFIKRCMSISTNELDRWRAETNVLELDSSVTVESLLDRASELLSGTLH